MFRVNEHHKTEKRRIPLSEPVFRGNEWKYVKDCIDSGWVSSAGKYVELFEQKIAEYVGTKYAVSTVNGTAAIHTALIVAGVGPGDKVIVPTLSFIATANPVLYCGAIPVFADSEKQTMNLDPEKATRKISQLVEKGESLKAIVVTHLYGHPCDIDPVLDTAHRYGIPVIEDACESLGSLYKGKMTGSLGDIGCLSFNGNKIITTGGGGMLITDKEDIASRARYLTTQARDHHTEYIHNETGYNYRMTNLQAALGLAQLEELPGFIEKKRAAAGIYMKEFEDSHDVLFLGEKAWARSNYWLSTVLLRDQDFPRQKLMDMFSSKGAELRFLFKPLHMQNAFSGAGNGGLEISEELYKRGVNLPSSVNMEESQVKEVAELVKTSVRKL